MTKTEKLFDKVLRKALTTACENIKDKCSGFSFLTHTVNLKKPNNSLQVSCYFIDEVAMSHASSTQQLPMIEGMIKEQLSLMDITPQSIRYFAD